jgi:outer membrane protein assembly factor BamB
VFKVELINDKTYVDLAEDQIYFIDKETQEIQSAPYYFENSKDFVVVDGQLLVLNSRGLWKYDTDKKAYYLLSEFQQDEEYVAGSLMVSDGGVYFSSASSRESLIDGEESKSAIYRVNSQSIAQ